MKPDESSLRFDLAYKYSEMKMKMLSLFHYKLLSSTNPSETNWNNLGVEYENNGLSIRSISAYRASEALGGTLAMSNLAYRFLNAGFANEANAICKDAIQIEGFDQRVTAAMNAINEKVDSEQKKMDALDAEIKSDQEFLVNYALAMAKPRIQDISGRLASSDCELDYELSNGSFQAYGVYEKDAMGSGLLSISSLYAFETKTEPTTKKLQTHMISYQGQVKGLAGTFKVSRDRKNEDGNSAATILGSVESTKDGMFYFDEDKNEFNLVELSADKESLRHYKLGVIRPALQG